MESIPFSSATEDYMSDINGMIRMENNALVIEYQTLSISDYFSGKKSDLNDVSIPLEEVAEISLKKNFFQSIVMLRTHKMKSTQKLPQPNNGEVKFYIKKKYRDNALQLIAEVNLRLSEIRLKSLDNNPDEY